MPVEPLHLIAGLAWDPEIRGFMAVFAGTVVLLGSVWLLLALNTGSRLGTLLASAGFFGWMVIMAAVWWIYGIGWVGSSPTWQLQEINVGDLSQAALDAAVTLPNPDQLPSAFELAVDSDNAVAQAEFGVVTEAHARSRPDRRSHRGRDRRTRGRRVGPQSGRHAVGAGRCGPWCDRRRPG